VATTLTEESMLHRPVPLMLVLLALAGCGLGRHGSHAAHEAHRHGHTTAPRRVVPDGAGAPLFNDLGTHRRPVTTRSALAQRYFDQGLVLTYGFNHAEAVRSFREAQRLDPDCAMCFWGEAYALGPNINKPMDEADAPAAWAAVQGALRAAPRATPQERALVEALAKRYAPEPPKDRAPLDRAYADAVRGVARAYPDDLDVQTLFAEAVMDTMPWAYYEQTGEPKAETQEITGVLESVLARAPDHPGALHLYIHVVEPSATPGRGEAAADRLRDLVPGAGHLVHMPSHIYLRVGRYHDASVANEKAAAADEAYISQCRVQGFYPATYYPHNIHFLWASAAFEGRSAVSIEAGRRVVAQVTDAMVAELPLVEEFLPVHLYGLARFGRWPEILAAPRPPVDRRYLTGAWHYVRGVALAATGDVGGAGAELARVRAIRDELAPKAIVFWSGARPDQLLDIGAHDLAGRLEGARGRWARALGPLREAVRLQDALPYTEPPPWYVPEREALGHALLRAGRPAEAEAVYRAQLERTPRNGWSLLGLAESLRAQGRTEEAAAAERERATAWQLADVTLPASIF
jgi:tetratricopeptide (TPR) repeat protein